MNSETFVYFVATQDRKMVKIGVSTSPAERLKNLAAWSPVPLDILAFVPGTWHDEKALHCRYFPQHSHKEWFKSTPEMLADIEAIARFGELPASWRGKRGQKNPLINLGIRATPEWRAKMSEIHKARWARERFERDTLRVIAKNMADAGLTIAQVNEMGARCVHQRLDGSLYVFSTTPEAEVTAAAELIARHAKRSREAA